MNLRDTLLTGHSKAQTMKIVQWIGASQERFDELLQIFLSADRRLVQRASWPVSYAVEAHPQLVKKHLNKLVSNLYKPGLHDAVKRNTVRLLQEMPIPKRLQGKVMDICFRFLESGQEAVAVRAFAITVLGKLAQQHPDILPELITVLETQLPHQTPAIRVRAGRVLNLKQPSSY